MKGIILYEDYRGKEVVEAIKLDEVIYNCKLGSSDDFWTTELGGITMESTQAYCNESDTYDFETGALIALMKMCKFDKSYKAIEEAFKYNSYDNKKNKELEEEIEKLRKENEKLQHEYDLCLNSENALKCSVDFLNKTIAKLNSAIDGYKNDLYKVSKRCMELEVKEDILNKQEETINKREEKMSVYFGGRGNGKQYKALVELFKKLDQKKVDAAYKEAYNTTLPVWQKEVLKQMYDVHKESKEKPIWLTSQSSTRDALDSLLESSKYAIPYTPYTVKWTKLPMKREEMWAEIFALHKYGDVIIKVKKEVVDTFLHDIENKIPEITWATNEKIFEAKYTIGSIYKELKTHDIMYFRLWKENCLSYSSDSYIYPYREHKHITYLPPMRWDLFKKGRIVVKVDSDNYEDFYDKCKKELGREPFNMYIGTFTVYYKNGYFHTRPYKDTIPYAKKIVDWEDVREFEEESE